MGFAHHPLVRRAAGIASAVILATTLAGCGGGGSGSSGGGGGGGGQPTITAVVLTFPTNAVPPGFINGNFNSAAVVKITDQHGAMISSATVSVNSTALIYVAADQSYEGGLSINPGDAVAVHASTAGVMYSASRQNFSTYPSITAPRAQTTWSTQSANVISWSGVAPDSTSKYAIGVTDTTGKLVWPSGNALDSVPTSTTSVTIPANTLTAGNRFVLVGIIDAVSIPGAAPGSGAAIGGFTYVPVSVTAPSAAPTSVGTSPPSVTVGIGKSVQLTATATFTDNSTADVTAQASWSSLNPAVVTVSATGAVTGVAGGTTTVMAQYQSFTSQSTVSVFQPNPSPAAPLTEGVAYQIDYAHSGGATAGANGPVFPPTGHWSVALAGTSISYPVVAGGRVFVLTNAAPAGGIYGTTLYALDVTTGNIVWGPTPISGTYSFAGLAYDHGTLFVVNFDGVMSTFDGATGTPGWSQQLPRFSQVTSPPTALNGVVYVTGDGGLAGIDERNGNAIFSGAFGTDHSSPAASGDGVLESNTCFALKVDPITGATLWNFVEGCDGAGGKTVAFANNSAYVRQLFDSTTSTSGNLILDAATGKQLGTFTAGPIPAFSATKGFFLDVKSGALSAIDLATGSVSWAFTGDGQLQSAPVVIDNTVVIGSRSGTVYALDATGKTLWSGSAGAAIDAPDEQNATVLTGFGFGDGYLIVPAGNTLNGWRVIP